TMAVVTLPIMRHLLRAPRQDLARQSFDLHPRQDQKPSVVDNPLQVALPLLITPSNPGVARLHLPSRRGPEQTREFPIAIPHPVAQVGAERHAPPQVMIGLRGLAPLLTSPLAVPH